MVSYYKDKGDPLGRSNYRGIKLLVNGLKLYKRVLDSRLIEIGSV